MFTNRHLSRSATISLATITWFLCAFRFLFWETVVGVHDTTVCVENVPLYLPQHWPSSDRIPEIPGYSLLLIYRQSVKCRDLYCDWSTVEAASGAPKSLKTLSSKGCSVCRAVCPNRTELHNWYKEVCVNPYDFFGIPVPYCGFRKTVLPDTAV